MNEIVNIEETLCFLGNKKIINLKDQEIIISIIDENEEEKTNKIENSLSKSDKRSKSLDSEEKYIYINKLDFKTNVNIRSDLDLSRF